jgi:GNAT superfamily N-acetyltransferase
MAFSFNNKNCIFVVNAIMEITIVKYQEGEEHEITGMIKTVYNEFVAPDYCDTGNQFFYEFIMPENISKRIQDGVDRLFTAKLDKKIIGVISFKNKSHLSLLFVLKEFQGKGVAKKLFDFYLENTKSDRISEFTVNASPYSKKIYEKLGFEALSEMQEANGIKYFPMNKKLK